MYFNINIHQHRQSEYDINDIFINRWSPRAMSGEEIEPAELMSLFEAARWAPSSYNNQSWRFLYARRNTKQWQMFLDFLYEGNQTWAKNAAALIVVISKTTFDHNNKPCPSHSFDTGAAWQNLALQGSMQEWVVHAMGGFDKEKTRQTLNIPDDYQIEAMIAVGKPGQIHDLPESLQQKEKPSGRKQTDEFVFEGKFPQ